MFSRLQTNPVCWQIDGTPGTVTGIQQSLHLLLRAILTVEMLHLQSTPRNHMPGTHNVNADPHKAMSGTDDVNADPHQGMSGTDDKVNADAHKGMSGTEDGNADVYKEVTTDGFNCWGIGKGMWTHPG
jgi:hypothetical protein